MRRLWVFFFCVGAVPASAQVCGNGVLEGDEYCEVDPRGGYYFNVSGLDCRDLGFDYGTLGCVGCEISTRNCRDTGYVQTCGNGKLEYDEQCDGGDHCSPTCRCVPSSTPVCGNRCRETGEQCDDGRITTTPRDMCDGSCRWVTRCNDGFLDYDEQCDLGAANADTIPDRCRTSCLLPRCGDSTVDTGEQCDDGPQNSNTIPDRCRANCVLPRCGDSVVDTGRDEECDRGAANADTMTAFCNTVCLRPRCGNGYVEPWETCDDGNQRDGDGCSALCNSFEICGNRIVDRAVGESCDDGNRVDGDGCDASCRIESCGNGILNPGEVCDDGNVEDGDGCSASCASDETCGNSVVDAPVGETCDDGNTDSGDGCRGDCTLERCGDGLVDPLEACDDGNTNADDGCAGCRVEDGWTCEDEPSNCTRLPEDAGVDAGVDAGPSDAGADAGRPDAGVDAGTEPSASGGCGCATADPRGAAWWVALAFAVWRRRR